MRAAGPRRRTSRSPTLRRPRGLRGPIHLLEALTELSLALDDSDPLLAARLLGAADAGYAERGIVRPEAESERFDALRARLAASLGDRGLAHAIAAGGGLELDEAVAEALALRDP